MSILTEELKSSVSCRGVEYEVHTDFRVWLKYDALMHKSVSAKEKIVRSIDLCYVGAYPPTAVEAAAALAEFFTQKELGEGRTSSTQGGRHGVRSFDFEADAPYIYAAFLSEYGIDLTKENLHWHLFMSLLQALGEDKKLVKIISWRGTSLAGIKNK